ncbi:AAA family ATPase [Actinomadura sp. WAC 06369]|uniref:AAA family ATPase n=1 Tax=Actinomadura sp. WAC 06369 TaxID=2203193 RepID=UPI0018F5C014|nr:AAA family ATPase [Actinomadura sp. WAC 06369]
MIGTLGGRRRDDAARRPRRSRPPLITDMRGDARAAGGPGAKVLRFAAGDVVMVSGLPGSGKSTLIRRTVAAVDGDGEPVRCVDSQDVRQAWERRLPAWVPYEVYRPGARIVHYVRLERALRRGGSVVVHDCGSRGWVRRWAAWRRRDRGSAVHLVLLDVPPSVAVEGQRSRSRTVPGRVFSRHRRGIGRLIGRVAEGRPPGGCAAVVLLDRRAADELHEIGFG